MIPSQLQPLANHLWQSTLFAAIAGLLTLALRKNRAQTRYWLWLAASVKFLVPFSILLDTGSRFGRHTPAAIAQSGLSSVIEQVSQPFAVPVPNVMMPAVSSSASLLPAILCAVWAIGFVTLVSSWWLRWQAIRAALRTASTLHLPINMEVMTSPAFPEPGVFGVRRPVLLLPAGITSHLTPSQFEAILTHELCHVRRRDNLATAIHMAVEAIFWFYPLVWWLGARLMEERELACDEEVLQRGSEPEVYAEGILKICELYLESRLPCVAGVTGANLKKRIETIMTNRVVLRLNFTKKVALTVVGLAALAVPIVVGMMNAPLIQAQSPPIGSAALPRFEVASIKPSDPSAPRRGRLAGPPIYTSAGRLTARNASLKQLIKGAYAHENYQLSGGPGWLDSTTFDVEAKSTDRANSDQLFLMLRALLADRFKLVFHRETKELAVYALVVAKNGPKFRASKAGADSEPGKDHLRQRDLPSLATYLTRLSIDKPVIDKTGLVGKFDLDLDMAKIAQEASLSGGAGGQHPTLERMFEATANALQDELGLKLVATSAPIEILVIDHVEKPSSN